jgi:dTDP-4-dehydrorhamnose reductase
MRVAVLGGSGMLGAMVLACLDRERAYELRTTARDRDGRRLIEERFPGVPVDALDAESATAEELTDALRGLDWVVNAVGVIKPYIHDDNGAEVERAVRVNALFPHALARAAARTGARVLQIATDCVYSGVRGGYLESDEHDARDVYGKSKSLGEAHLPHIHHLRCSIIGPEITRHVSLLDWFVRQPAGATVRGFLNHRWNGVTTLHFGRICRGIIERHMVLPHLIHVLPSDIVNKAELLAAMATAYDRRDVTITPVDAAVAVDRTLATSQPDLNSQLWKAAGYDAIPSIAGMLDELAETRLDQGARASS